MVAVFGAIGILGLIALLAATSKDAHASPTAALPAGKKELSKAQQEAMAGALRALTVDAQGNIVGPVTADALRFATQTAGRLEEEGFPEAGATLRSFAQKAASYVPPVKPEKQVPLPQGISPELQEKIQKLIQYERDPKKLQAMVDALAPYKNQAAGKMAIDMISALILQIKAQNEAQRALEAADQVMKTPMGEVLPEPEPAAKPVAVAPKPVLETPKAVAVPAQPKPQVLPEPKSPVVQAGEAMASHLKSVQSKHGMPGAKGKEDPSITVRFQNLAGITADGKPGPGTIAKLATYGVGNLPLVMYWPSGSNRLSVQKYRDTLRRLASEAEAQGHAPLANELRMVANYEKGQGGIAQYGPALT